MGKINRQPTEAARSKYDLIIIGGGIYGVALTLEASRRGLRPLVIERNDFGGATSNNSLRILHGGLRYLQSLDLRRFMESVSERKWFLRRFSPLVRPLPCLMPLYGDGLRRRSVLRTALWGNDLLSRNRNRQMTPENRLPAGQVIGVSETKKIFPGVDPRGLEGGAIWFDALMPDSQRLVIEILRWACELGATALNYVEALDLIRRGERVAGVIGIDRETGKSFEYKADTVINAAGPWSRGIAKDFDKDYPFLFHGSLAWNVLLNRKALSSHGLALAPRKTGGRVYFLIPWKGMLLAGTGHAPWDGNFEHTNPPAEYLKEFLEDLNSAIPGLFLGEKDIVRVFSGLLPATESGSTNLSKRETILDHAEYGGPRGLISISGVKFTTSRLVAEKTLGKIYPGFRHPAGISPESVPNSFFRRYQACDHFDDFPDTEEPSWRGSMRRLAEEEAVQHLDDLVLRRTSLGDNPSRAIKIAPSICSLMGWDETRSKKEIGRLESLLGNPERTKNHEVIS